MNSHTLPWGGFISTIGALQMIAQLFILASISNFVPAMTSEKVVASTASQQLETMQKGGEFLKKIPLAGLVTVILTATASTLVFLLMDLFRCQEKGRRILSSDIDLPLVNCGAPSTFSSQAVGAVAIIICCLGSLTFCVHKQYFSRDPLVLIL